MNTKRSASDSDNLLKALYLEPLDIGCTRGAGLYGWLIRSATRSRGEDASRCNHVFAGFSPGVLGDLMAIKPQARIIEALWHVKAHPCTYSASEVVAIYRPLDLTGEQARTIQLSLFSRLGQRYGYAKIPLHALDWILFNNRVICRKLAKTWKYQECSGLIASAWSDAGLTFGVEPYAAQPDDIQDYCATHPAKYRMIWTNQINLAPKDRTERSTIHSSEENHA